MRPECTDHLQFAERGPLPHVILISQARSHLCSSVHVFDARIMKLSSFLSVRNVLRVSGVVALSVGGPIALLPGVASMVYFGKRPSSCTAEKEALNLTMRAMGIAIGANGVKALAGPASTAALAGDLVLEGFMCLFNWGSRTSGKWKKAGGVMEANLFFAVASSAVVALQAASLRLGDRPDDCEPAKSRA